MSNWMRQLHRWMAGIFTIVVAGIFAMMGMGQKPAEWIFFVPLAPLGFLMLSGLYMLALPYLRRSAR